MMMMMLFLKKINHIAIIALCGMIKKKQMLLVRATEDKEKPKQTPPTPLKKATDGLVIVLDASIPAEFSPG